MSVADQSRELHIYVKDADEWPLAGAHIFLLVDGAPFASTYEGNGQATFTISGPPQTLGVLATYKKWSEQALLGPETNVHTFHFGEVHLMKKQDRIALWVGLGLAAVSLTLAVIYPDPKPLLETLIRMTFSLGAGGIASIIPGMLNIKIGTGKRLAITAAGALAVFLLTFVAVPGKNPLF